MKYSNGAFIRRFCWDLEKIIPPKSAEENGYIVQHIERVTTDSRGKYSTKSGEKHSPYNHSYWEAWQVNNGTITLLNFGYDDSWESMPNGWNSFFTQDPSVEMLKLFADRYNTSGCTLMNGTVYWAPTNSELFELVNTEFRDKVCYAKALPAVWEIEMPQNVICVGAHSFTCSWDLSNEELFAKSVMTYISTHPDCEMVKRAIEASFEEEHLQRVILDAYENVCQNIYNDARKNIIERPQIVKEFIIRKTAKGQGGHS